MRLLAALGSAPIASTLAFAAFAEDASADAETEAAAGDDAEVDAEEAVAQQLGSSACSVSATSGTASGAWVLAAALAATATLTRRSSSSRRRAHRAGVR